MRPRATSEPTPRTPRRETPAHTRPAAPGPGRPRLTREKLQSRIADYCHRHGVNVNDEGLPPFPAGKRETEQHREWMSLYKAHHRLSERGSGTADLAQRQELLAAQRGRCPVCRRPLELDDSRLDTQKAEPAVLHERCLQLVGLARAVGPEALDRVKDRL
jgi:hypothetical protein